MQLVVWQSEPISRQFHSELQFQGLLILRKVPYDHQKADRRPVGYISYTAKGARRKNAPLFTRSQLVDRRL